MRTMPRDMAIHVADGKIRFKGETYQVNIVELYNGKKPLLDS